MGPSRDFLRSHLSTILLKQNLSLINAGIYILEPKVLDLIQEGQNGSFEYEVFPKLLEKRMNFRSYVLENEYWCDIGTPEKYLGAHLDFLNGKVKRFDFERKAESAEIATSTNVDKTSVIGENCVIKPSAQIINSVLGEGVHVEEKAIIENSVIWPFTRVSNSAKIRKAIIAKGCYIGKNARVSEGAVLGDKTSLPDYTIV